MYQGFAAQRPHLHTRGSIFVHQGVQMYQGPGDTRDRVLGRIPGQGRQGGGE